jgi:regulator of sigma E protease
MNIILFIIILSVLVFVHEAGHFLAAKLFGIRVDEFGLGYPPRAKKLFRWRGTDFTLNWLPFGGFVKIFGEDPSTEALHAKDSFVSKPRGAQALVLVAGVFFNFLLAGVFLSIGFMIGMSSPVDLGIPATNAHTDITQILPNSPADTAGLRTGDEILLISRGSDQIGAGAKITPDGASKFISGSTDPLQVTVKRGNELFTKSITPKEGIVEGKPALGFGLAEITILKLSPLKAIYAGFKSAIILTKETAKSLWKFLSQAVVGKADLSQVTGPVGLVGVVGDVVKIGFVYLLSFAALISVNLSIVNLLPFPALDGGRLLFVVIESIIRRPISTRIVNALNNIGFALLILLMILITIRDVRHIL